MAWTVSKLAQYNEGNQCVQHWSLVADSATLELSTGLKNVLGIYVGINSATSALVKFKPNILSAGTAAGGNVAVTGATSADAFYVMVVGN